MLFLECEEAPRDLVDPALPCVVDRTARVGREARPENYAGIEQIGVFDDSFADASGCLVDESKYQPIDELALGRRISLAPLWLAVPVLIKATGR